MNFKHILDHRKWFWDEFEKRYAAKQQFETCDYGILEFDKYWPDDIKMQYPTTQENCCQQKNRGDEVMYDSSSLQLNHLSENKCDAKNDSNQKHSEEERKECVVKCRVCKLIHSSDNGDIRTSKTKMKCCIQLNKIPLVYISKADVEICGTKLEALREMQFDTAIDGLIHTLPKSKVTTKQEALPDMQFYTAVDGPIDTLKIKNKSASIKSHLPNKNGQQMHKDVTESDLKLPFGNMRVTSSGTVETSKQASDIHCRENINGNLGHIMGNATIFEFAETAEVQQEYKLNQQSKSNLSQRNKREADINTRGKAFNIHGSTALKPCGNKVLQKSYVGDKTEVHVQESKMAQHTENIKENSLLLTATENICQNNCLVKQKMEEEGTGYITGDVTVNAINGNKKLSKICKNSFRHQVLTCSLSKIRNFTATKGQDDFTSRNEKLNRISDGEIFTSLNSQSTKELVFTEDALKEDNQRQKQLQRKLKNTKKRGANIEKGSKAEFCESNEINSCKHNPNRLIDPEGTTSQSKHHHMEIEGQEELKRIKIDVKSLHTKSSTYEGTSVQNKSLKKLPSGTFFQSPYFSKSRQKSTRNANEAHVTPITLEKLEHLTNGSFINNSIKERLHHEHYEKDILINKFVAKEIRKTLNSKTDKQNRENVNEVSVKPFPSKPNQFLVSEQCKLTTKELQDADILKGMNKYNISSNSSNGLLCVQDTLSRNKCEETEVQVKIKQRKVDNVALARDAKDGASANLATMESSFCSNSDCSVIRQLQNKYFASGITPTQKEASNKSLSQLQQQTSVPDVECLSDLSSHCIVTKFSNNFSSENWTSFRTKRY